MKGGHTIRCRYFGWREDLYHGSWHHCRPWIRVRRLRRDSVTPLLCVCIPFTTVSPDSMCLYIPSCNIVLMMNLSSLSHRVYLRSPLIGAISLYCFCTWPQAVFKGSKVKLKPQISDHCTVALPAELQWPSAPCIWPGSGRTPLQRGASGVRTILSVRLLRTRSLKMETHRWKRFKPVSDWGGKKNHSTSQNNLTSSLTSWGQQNQHIATDWNRRCVVRPSCNLN